ncbi:MAG: radical SAM protein, partial [Myxococcota bacterium]|nr:radical SAM protein [Myxococcota bacterium]
MTRRGTGLWALRPSELAALPLSILPESLFTQLQQQWRWPNGVAPLGAQSRRALAPFDDFVPRIVERQRAEDGATRVLFELADGACVEAVHMPRQVRVPRVTYCLSTQHGCSVGCRFCASACLGFRRNLKASEMVAQVHVLMRELGPARPHSINLVFMGMGEPLHNLTELLRAIDILCDSRGLGIPPRRITVSTCGVLPGIQGLARAPVRPELALSLHTVDEALRRSLMPGARWPLDALRLCLEAWPRRPREKTIFEVVLIDGINDSPAQADAIRAWVGSMPHNINVIRY